MADGYEPLRGGQPGFEPLMQLLLNMQRQGAIEKQMAWQGLGRGIEGLGGGIGAARAEARQRSDTDRRIGQEQAFTAGQAQKQRTFTDEQRMKGVGAALSLEDYRSRNDAMMNAARDNAAMAREKEQQRGYTERETIAQKESTARARPTMLDYLKTVGAGAKAIGGGMMSVAELQRKLMKDVTDAAIEREKIASRENLSKDRLAVEAANRAAARNDAQGVRAVNFANAKRRALVDRAKRAKNEFDKRTYNGQVEAPKGLADAVNSAEFDAQQAEGEFFELIAKYGVSPEMANPNMAAPAADGGALAFDDILDNVAEGD